VHALDARGDCEIIGVSRRALDFATRAQFVALDLTDKRFRGRVF
jgi:hypothetical protein